MAKEIKDEVQVLRKDKQTKAEQLAGLKRLRRDGVITRQQFRLWTFEKGLQGSTKGSPMITHYELSKDDAQGKVVSGKIQQWTRI